MKQRKIYLGKTILLTGSGVNLEMNRFRKYPEDGRKLMFLTVGRIMKDKGIEELLMCAEKIKERYPNVIFRLVGMFDQEQYRPMVEKAVKKGNIEYLGQRDDVPELMAQSHAIIHPSYHEGLSNVLLESAACGRPIIASDIPGCKETFDNGITGIGFSPKNTQALIEAVEKFIQLPYEKKIDMGMLGRKKVEVEFDRNIVIETYLEEMRKLESGEHA